MIPFFDRSTDATARFVFPSEIAAEYWRRFAATFGERRAIRTDRFMSWDTFKERYLSSRRDEAPANRVVRRIFASELCSEIEARGGYRSLVPEAHAGNARRFAADIVAILPSLAYLVRDAQAGAIELRGEAASDLFRLFRRYTGYLCEHRLFEPTYLDTERLAADYPVVLVFPRLIDDFSRFAPQVEHAEIVDQPATSSYELRRFDNTLSELDRLCESIVALLRNGVHPEEIAVSVVGLDEIAGMLEEAARIRSLPIDLRAGKPLARYPAGNLFERIQICANSGFDLERFKPLLLDPRIPWVNREYNARLIRAGIDTRCGRNGVRDAWLDRLERRDRPGAGRIAGYYRALRNAIRAMIDAPTVRELRRSVLAFVNGFLDSSRLDPARLRVFEAVIGELAPLEATASMLGDPPHLSPYALWLEELAEHVYVERSSHLAVPVYPYRVAAGIYPAYHFVVNAADQRVRVEDRRFPFLPAHARGRGLDVRHDRTAAFLRAYSISGSRVLFSAARTGLAGPMTLPTELFDRPGAEPDPAGVAAADSAPDGTSAIDPFVVERGYWRGGAPGPLYPVQRLGFLRSRRDADAGANASDRSEPLNLVRQVNLDPVLNDRLAARRRDEDGRIVVSPTGLDAWSACRFRYLVSYVLGIDEPTYRVSPIDSMLEGEALHLLVEKLFDRIGAADADGLDPGSLDEYRECADELLADFAHHSLERFPQPNALLLDERIEAFRAALYGVLAWEAESRRRVVAVERDYTVVLGDVVVRGRIDRVSGDDGTVVVVDYKRSTIPSRGDLLPYENAKTRQIPLYVLFVERDGKTVSGAYYYSLLKGNAAPVYVEGAKSWFNRETLDEFIEASKAAAREMAHTIVSGDYRAPVGSTACESCRLRAVCRRRYAIR